MKAKFRLVTFQEAECSELSQWTGWILKIMNSWQTILILRALAQTRKILVKNLTETETCFCVPIKHASPLHEKNNVLTSKNMQKYSKGKPEQLIFTDHN